ncbi:tetratricopeptide repeat protein [uncultured Sphingomonas sp.]|uniref:tetratricopeptide repeat protein n=1 Tax=uncultured Sphingomonas sp. TaxID=158754 RepID=UPI0025F4B9F2|nr:tetratricopeptide repeat protein [uncultured Sphingomonas sp.]
MSCALSATFERNGQPRRYGSSLLWNGVPGLSLAGFGLRLAIDLPRQTLREACAGREKQPGDIQACNRLIAEHDLKGEDLAEAIGETLAAIHYYIVALNRDPDNIDAHLYRGILALNVGDLQVASDDFDAVLRARPVNVDARANRGLTHVWRGDANLARADFSAVRAAGPQHPAMLRGEVALALRAGDGDTALWHLDAALRADPNDHRALERRSAIFRSLGDTAKAAADPERLRMVERAEYRRQYEH